MQKQVWMSALLAASLAFWCGCGGQPAGNGQANADGNASDAAPQGGTNSADGTDGAGGTNGGGGTKTGGGTNGGGGANAGNSDTSTSYISADFAAAAVVHPKRAMQSKLMATFRSLPDVLKQGAANPDMRMMMGGNNEEQAESIEEVIGLLAPVEGIPPVAPAAIVRFSDAKAAAEMTDRMKAEGEKRTYAGKTYYVRTANVQEFDRMEVPTEELADRLEDLKGVYEGADFKTVKSEDGKTTTIVISLTREIGPGEPNAAFLPDDKTVVTSTEALLKKMMDAKGVSPLAEQLAALGPDHDLAVVALVDRLRPAVKMAIDQMGPLPPPMAPVAPLLESVDELRTVKITAGLDADPLVKIDIEAENAGAAEQLQGQIGNVLLIGQGLYAGAVKAALEEKPAAKPLFDISDKLVNGVSVKMEGTRVVATVPGLTGLEGLSEKLKPLIEDAKKSQRFNNLRQIGLGVYNYHDLTGMLPGNVTSEEGKTVLSWRVAVLLTLERGDLWEEFNKEQAWDSEQNKPLLEKLPEVFQSPFGGAKPGQTVYLMFQGPGTVLDGKNHTLSDIADGLSDTIMVIEVSPEKAVPWTQPKDIDFTAADLMQAIGPPPTKEGYPATFFDGHVDVIPATLDIDTFKRLIRIDDGQPSGFMP